MVLVGLRGGLTSTMTGWVRDFGLEGSVTKYWGDGEEYWAEEVFGLGVGLWPIVIGGMGTKAKGSDPSNKFGSRIEFKSVAIWFVIRTGGGRVGVPDTKDEWPPVPSGTESELHDCGVPVGTETFCTVRVGTTRVRDTSRIRAVEKSDLISSRL